MYWFVHGAEISLVGSFLSSDMSQALHLAQKGRLAEGLGRG